MTLAAIIPLGSAQATAARQAQGEGHHQEQRLGPPAQAPAQAVAQQRDTGSRPLGPAQATASNGKHWRRSPPLPTGTWAQKSPGHGLGAFAGQGAGAGYNSNSMMAGVTW